MELDKFTAMETYTAIFWGVTIVILNVVTTVFKQFALRVFRELIIDSDCSKSFFNT